VLFAGRIDDHAALAKRQRRDVLGARDAVALGVIDNLEFRVGMIDAANSEPRRRAPAMNVFEGRFHMTPSQ
jgi:hypothetical protein